MIDVFVSGLVTGATVVGYFCRRALRRRYNAEVLRKKAEEICDQVEEGGPFLFKEVVEFVKDGQIYGDRKTGCNWISCRSCKVAGAVTLESPLKICGCVAHSKDHFHWKCRACGYRFIIRNGQDVDTKEEKKPKEVEIARPSAGSLEEQWQKTCNCGCKKAYDAGEFWRCASCGNNRKKTPINTPYEVIAVDNKGAS